MARMVFLPAKARSLVLQFKLPGLPRKRFACLRCRSALATWLGPRSLMGWMCECGLARCSPLNPTAGGGPGATSCCVSSAFAAAAQCTACRLMLLVLVRRQLAHSPLLRCTSEAAAAQAVALLRRLGSWQGRREAPRLLVVINPQSGRGRCA